MIIHDTTNDTYYGVRKEAERLNVSAGHLSRFLRGERTSARLSAELKGKIAEVK